MHEHDLPLDDGDSERAVVQHVHGMGVVMRMVSEVGPGAKGGTVRWMRVVCSAVKELARVDGHLSSRTL